jgi:long-chain acyl-CoA synthetase
MAMARVALIGENSIEYVDTLLDIWNNGDCALLVDWRIPPLAASAMMLEAGVRVCFIERAVYDKGGVAWSSEIHFELFERVGNSAVLLPDRIYDKFRENYSRDEAIVIYSSGTTGKSKGVILSHYAINSNADAIIDYMWPAYGDCIYIAKTISHSSTITGELLVALKTKTKLVVAPVIVPPRFVLNSIPKFGVTIICLNPTLLKMLAEEFERGDYDLSSLRVIYSSGEILNDRIYELAHRVFGDIPVYNVYGLTEAGPRISAQRADCCKSNSVGKPLKGVDVAIVDDGGNVLLPGERGVIHVNTPGRYAGYIIGTEKFPSLYSGWLNTGDVGYWDEFGELHVVNRIDDVIIIDGHKVYPSYVERVICEVAGAEECRVCREVSDVNGMPYIAAYVTLGSERVGEVLSLDLYTLSQKLSSHEIPKRLYGMQIPHCQYILSKNKHISYNSRGVGSD